MTNESKPIVVYVDDEPHNLTVFDSMMDGEWEIITFSDPVKALAQLRTTSPAVIITDQRMPHMSGVAFLELAKQINPESVRIIVTGYSDEDLVVEAVRKVGIYDYIKKPWDPLDLKASVQRAVEFYQSESKTKYLLKELQKSQEELKEANEDLKQSAVKLELAALKEKEMRTELQSWVPPMILYAINNNIKFPITTDLIGVSFDIIGSSKIHEVVLKGRPIRAHIIQSFTECVLKHGGWRESHSGDSAYAHFGAIEKVEAAADSALAAAREFRVALRGLSQACGTSIEAGISLHACPGAVFDLHMAQLNTPQGIVIQKSFDTSAPEVDVLHRIEKLVHKLPGSNIVMSAEFLKELTTNTRESLKLKDIGVHSVVGSDKVFHLFILPSDSVKMEDQELQKFLKEVA